MAKPEKPTSEVGGVKYMDRQVYHVFSRSIAEFKIFNTEADFWRIKNSIYYYQQMKPSLNFSNYIKLPRVRESYANGKLVLDFAENKIVEIVAYCFMPTHIHLVLKEIREGGISVFMGNILNSYTRYFNIKHNRKGPLWESKFKRVVVDSDEQLLHLTRYVHLNPVTAYLVNKPQDWPASSYNEYAGVEKENGICVYDGVLDIHPLTYKKFVDERIEYQRELGKIKNLCFD